MREYVKKGIDMNIKSLLLTLIVASVSVQTVFAGVSSVSLRAPKQGEVVIENGNTGLGKEAVLYLHDTNNDVVGAIRIAVQGNR